MVEKTHYAPAIRSTKDEILKEYNRVGSQKFFTEIFGAMTGVGAVIDKNRQIVYANDEFLSLLGINTIEPILGKRTGEVVGCIHSNEEEGGCGTSKACEYCGAVNAILESQKSGMKSMKETRISSIIDGKHKSWDLNVSSTPISISGEVFYVLMLQDISDEKRRFVLERIFFHDLLNSAGGLNGLLTMLKEGTDPEEARELIKLSEEASRDIIEEIILHRQLRSAEKGDLDVKIETVNSSVLIESAIGKISSHDVGLEKQIVVSDKSADLDFETDKVLFQRVITNLIKNALEATEKGGSVGIEVVNAINKLVFRIRNAHVIPQEVQLQLFQRSFSTKGLSRGIGTYSIKLLTENYLKGKVSFVSNEKEGTVFSVELNKKFPAD